MNINWNEKPDWAIGHAVVKANNSEVWFNDKQYQYLGNDCVTPFTLGWNRSALINEQYPPETKSEWNGEELPPMDTVCEVLNINTWHLTKIIGYDNGLPVFKVDWSDKYCYACGEDFKFRPIKSDKEKWVEQLCKTLSIVPNGSDWLDAIYDALISGELPIPKGIKNESK